MEPEHQEAPAQAVDPAQARPAGVAEPEPGAPGPQPEQPAEQEQRRGQGPAQALPLLRPVRRREAEPRRLLRQAKPERSRPQTGLWAGGPRRRLRLKKR